jgi:hypothetical protein
VSRGLIVSYDIEGYKLRKKDKTPWAYNIEIDVLLYLRRTSK